MFSVLFQTMASAEGLLQCSVCFNPFDDQNICPRNLSCGHSFCTSCLERLPGKCFLERGANLDSWAEHIQLKNTQVPFPPPPPPGDEIPQCGHLNMSSGEPDFLAQK